MLHSVIGIANVTICAIFETKRENVIKSQGRYARTIAENNTDDELLLTMTREIFIAKEYCTITYSKDTFKLLKFAIPDWFNEKKVGMERRNKK